MNHKIFFISASIIISTVFIAAIFFYQSQQPSKITDEQLSALTRINAPFKGNKQAKVTIVEFFDPACETCSQFYPLVDSLVKHSQGRVKVIMRYAPLHQGSDDVVKMLEAAHNQGKFWPAAELLFTNQERWIEHHVSQPAQALAGIKTLKLDHKKLELDWKSVKTAQIVEQDRQDGILLKVRATPQFFVNGKPLVVFGYQELIDLVDAEIAKVY